MNSLMLLTEEFGKLFKDVLAFSLMNKTHHVPTGEKVIGVLYYIGAVLGIIFGLLFLLGAGALESIAEQIPLLAALGAGLFVIVGVILIAFGILGSGLHHNSILIFFRAFSHMATIKIISNGKNTEPTRLIRPIKLCSPNKYKITGIKITKDALNPAGQERSCSNTFRAFNPITI